VAGGLVSSIERPRLARRGGNLTLAVGVWAAVVAACTSSLLTGLVAAGTENSVLASMRIPGSAVALALGAFVIVGLIGTGRLREIVAEEAAIGGGSSAD
jgi:hypothetical protein